MFSNACLNEHRSKSQICRYIDGLRIICFSVPSVNIHVLDEVIMQMVIAIWERLQLISLNATILFDIQQHLLNRGKAAYSLVIL